jgi:hypothetical protein
MLNFCGIVSAILKIATGRNFSMSGIIPGQVKPKAMKLLFVASLH